jgi:hypothetical protein
MWAESAGSMIMSCWPAADTGKIFSGPGEGVISGTFSTEPLRSSLEEGRC